MLKGGGREIGQRGQEWKEEAPFLGREIKVNTSNQQGDFPSSLDSPLWPSRLPELPRSQRERLLQKGALVSIDEIFAPIADARRRQGQRYELGYLLTCLVAAMLCGRNCTLAVAEWCGHEQPR